MLKLAVNLPLPQMLRFYRVLEMLMLLLFRTIASAVQCHLSTTLRSRYSLKYIAFCTIEIHL